MTSIWSAQKPHHPVETNSIYCGDCGEEFFTHREFIDHLCDNVESTVHCVNVCDGDCI